jgi:phospholipase C
MPQRRRRSPQSRPKVRRRLAPVSTGADLIQHVVLLMLENRSFDTVLGCLPGVDGVDSSPAAPEHRQRRAGL